MALRKKPFLETLMFGNCRANEMSNQVDFGPTSHPKVVGPKTSHQVVGSTKCRTKDTSQSCRTNEVSGHRGVGQVISSQIMLN